MTTAAQPVLFGSTAEKDFKRLTSSRYHTMVDRFKEKRDKNKRITRHARIVPFTDKQYQAWVLEQMGGKFDGARRCYYECGEWINVNTMVNDHRHPVSLGGSLGLENLVACCKACNDLKGKLPEKDFIALKDALLHCLTPFGAQEVTSRLRKAVSLAAGARWGQKKAQQQHQGPTNPAMQERDDDADF